MNPKEIPKEDLPLQVFSTDSSGFIGFIIRWRTKSQYSHVMIMRSPGKVCSQGNTYSEVPIDRYLKKTNRLKFVKFDGMNSTDKMLVNVSIDRKLKLPWYKKAYDWFGILGQAIGIKKVNIAGLNYCSEDVVLHFTFGIDYVKNIVLRDFLSMLPLHGSPEDLNAYNKENKDVAKVYGTWSGDEI